MTQRIADRFDMSEYVSEACSLFAELHETMRNNLDKSNLAGIPVDHVDANVIALGIGGIQKEADWLRVISLCSPDYLFSIGESLGARQK